MELIVSDSDFNSPQVIDLFESLIWVERYSEYGDFEIYTRASEETFNLLKEDYFLRLKESDRVMIIEGCEIIADVEEGDQMIFTGRSYESVLDRRIVWQQTVLTGNLQNGIELLLNENAISPTDPNRTIPNLIFEASTDSIITALTVKAQFTRTNLYESIKGLCDTNNIGFRITYSDSLGKFVFKLYAGVDRSYDQITNPHVVFSEKFENLVDNKYSESNKKLKTLTIVAGEGEGSDRKTTIVDHGETGLLRRELYTDARDLSQTVDEVPLTDEEYLAQLTQRGKEDLLRCVKEKNFDGNVDTTQSFKYGIDFFLGDLVQNVSKYGIKSKSRVSEVIRSQNMEGIYIYPTFTMLE